MSGEIAIVGLGCRFPGADNLEEFWRVLVEGENHVREVDNERWNFYDYYDPDIHAEGKTAVNRAGLLKNIEEWDNEFFGVSDNEAKVVDPQQRLVLDCCHMAMEDAGITRNRLDGSQTSVYVGAMNDDFKERKSIFTAADSAYSVTGIFRSILSARVSYTFNLKGPCMVVDTACSSSLVAIHLACQSLKTNESDMAFAGGVSVLLDPSPFVPLSKARMLSPTGQCQTFSSDANGYARGEGCGMVILQRLEDALRDGNNIWGIIKTGSNQDGRMVTPMTAPSSVQQLELLRRVYRDDEDGRNRVQVIEAHGTGTPIGDPTEVNALGEFFKDTETAKRDKIVIGSVKTNIGHLESAAGVAGLIKVVLMMRNETIVPSLMYSEKRRNPKLNFETFNFIVPTDTLKWNPNNNRARVACVNSFGFGGSNAHLFIKQWMKKSKTNDDRELFVTKDEHLVVISSLSQRGLEKNITQFKEDVGRASAELSEISQTSLYRRDHFKHRIAFIASSKEDLQKQCLAQMKGNDKQRSHEAIQIVFVFCGVGTTWHGMCIELLQNRIFRTAVMSVDKRLQKYTRWSIIEKWTNKEDVSDPLVSHLSIFVCQVGLTAVWKAVGIIPDAVIGQSVGEVAACLASGVIDEDAAVKIIYHRSLLLSQCQSGGMLVVRNVDVKVVQKMCQEIGDINIAVYISPVACTVSGQQAAVDRMEKALQEKTNIRVKKLDVSCGYHSPMVRKAGEKLQTSLAGFVDRTKVFNGKQEIPIISTVHGKEIERDEYRKCTYWRDNVTKPVQFHSAISQSVGNREYTVFLEIGPSPVLLAHSVDILAQNIGFEVVPSVLKGKEYTSLLKALATVYELGIKLDFGALFQPATQTQPSLLPRYIFSKKRFPVPKEYDIKKTEVLKDKDQTTHKYVSFRKGSNMDDFLTLQISEETTPFVYQHVVRDTIIVPGAIYADVGFEIGRRLLHVDLLKLNVTLDLLKAVPLNKGENASMNVHFKENDVGASQFSFQIHHNTEIVCKGTVKEDSTTKASYVTLDSMYLDLQEKVSSSEIYSTLHNAGFKYGPQLQVIRDGVKNKKKSLLDIEVTDDVIKDETHIHPCILDAMLQTIVVFTTQADSSTEKVQYLPVGMDAVRITKNLRTIGRSTNLKVLTEKVCEVSLETTKKHHFNIYLIDGRGFILAEVRNFTVYATNRQMKGCDDLRYALTWRLSTDDYSKSYTAKHGGKVLLVNANEILATFFRQSMHEIEFCDFDGSIFKGKMNDLDDKLEHCSAVVIFFSSCTKSLDDAHYVYSRVSRNFRILRGFILYLAKQEKNSPEVFLLTEGVHSEHYTGKSSENYTKNTSFIGSEIWGFFRNLQVEFVYNKLTVIDIASLSTACLEALLVVMGKAKVNQKPNGREYMICGRDVYEVHINATSKRCRMPTLRFHDKQYSSYASNVVLYTSGRYLIKDPFVVYTDARESCLHLSKDPLVDIEVLEVCIHDSNLYPATYVNWSGNYNLRLQKEDESGYKVIAIEMIGRKRSATKTKQTNADNEFYVVCFPTIASRFIRVPDKCCLRLNEIHRYTPGLLHTSILLHEMLMDVPSDSEIYVLKSDFTAGIRVLIQSILKRQRKTCAVESIDALTKTKLVSSSKAVALVLQSTDAKDAYDILKHFKLIVGLSYCLSETFKQKLAHFGEVSVKTVDPKSVFESSRLARRVEDVGNHFKSVKIGLSSEKLGKQEFGNPLRTLTLLSNSGGGNVMTNYYNCRVKVSQDNLFDKMGTYIVVGGLTGVGWMIVELMAEMGAGIIITFGRRECSVEMEKTIKTLIDQFKCRIIHYKVDVSETPGVADAIKNIEGRFPDHPIRGVFQGAGVVRSATLAKYTNDQIDQVLMPKVLGTINLHNATKHLRLDYFVLLSSISSILGSVGQINYGAANSFLDAFADNRRQLGYNVQSINWGAISSGMATVGNVARDLEIRGHIHLKREEFRSCFIHCLMMNESNVIYANLDHDSLLKYLDAADMFFHAKKLDFLWEYKKATSKGENENSTAQFDKSLLKGKSKAEKTRVVQDALKVICSAASSQTFEDSDIEEPFVAMGIDSMATITIVSIIKSNFGVTLKSETLLDPDSSIKTLAAIIVATLDRQA